MSDPVGMIYSAVGGEEPYRRLVEEFYAGVEGDPVLRPLYPQDLSEPKENLALFLIQRTGGPGTYSLQRGHPRMRLRHMRFKIGQPERDAWIRNMSGALARVPEFDAHRQVLNEFFEHFASFLINHPLQIVGSE